MSLHLSMVALSGQLTATQENRVCLFQTRSGTGAIKAVQQTEADQEDKVCCWTGTGQSGGRVRGQDGGQNLCHPLDDGKLILQQVGSFL